MPQKQVIIVATEGDPTPSSGGLSPLAAAITTLVVVVTLVLIGWAGVKLFEWVWPAVENILLALALLIYTMALGSKRTKPTEEQKKTSLFDQMLKSAESKRTPEMGPLGEDAKLGFKIMAYTLLLLMVTAILSLDFALTFLLFKHATNSAYQLHPAINVLGLAATTTAAWWSFNGIRNFYKAMRILSQPSEEQKLLPFVVGKLLVVIVAAYLVVVFLIKFGIL